MSLQTRGRITWRRSNGSRAGAGAIIRSFAIFIVLVLVGCTPKYRMGDPISAPPASERRTAESTPAAQEGATQHASARAEQKADLWDAVWQQIQGPSDTVTWSDHMQVCGLKYRFRNYDQLFRCLDLLEAKIAVGGKRVEKADLVQRGAPVMIGWLRASAYAELGEPEIALKWAESAWAALPDALRSANSDIFGTGFFGSMPDELRPVFWVAMTLGSSGTGIETADMQEGMYHEGRNNPAALDFRPPFVTMTLAAQRSLLFQRLGDTAKSDAALHDLERWQQTEWKGGGMTLIPSHIKPFGARAQLFSIGPLFVKGEYSQVVWYYEALAKSFDKARAKESRSQTLQSILGGGFVSGAIMGAMAPSDTRLFAIAVEDIANALLYAQSLERVGRTADARNMLDTLLAKDEIRAMGNLYWVALYERGSIALREGQQDEGIRLLTRSVEAIESVRSTISFEAAKIGFAGDKQTVYAALVSAFASRGDWRDAFLYAERAKARALVDLLAQHRDLGPPPSGDERVRDLLAHAETVDTSLGLATSDESVRGIKIVADAREQLSQVAPETASLISVQNVDAGAIATRLGADESLIDYYGQGDDLYAFVLHGSTIAGYRLSAKGLDDDVRAFRDAIDRRDDRARDIGRGLYDRLVRPLLADLPGRELTIAPHGALHYLPFAALSDGNAYLLDRFSVRLVPSASTLVYLRADEPKKVGRLLALGNPDLGDRALDLPNAQAEAKAVAAMFPDSRALLRSDASKSAAMSLANGFAMLHFATHGRFDANAPLRSGLYLAKGTEPDGLLSVGDLYSLRWDVDLVTLSACETGLGKIASGDDVIGLTRGFLYAGARTIVASLWEVDDAATAELMEAFYRNLGNGDKREALRLAQIETRERYPEPWYWAAFNVLGRAD